jgi:tRNA A-37 threonylcarbamoyl transferase component Bud32
VIRVVHPPVVVQDVGGFMVTELGTMVERKDCKRIIEALATLHCFDVTYGDAHVYNVVEGNHVEVVTSIQWIDFRTALTNNSSVSK